MSTTVAVWRIPRSTTKASTAARSGRNVVAHTTMSPRPETASLGSWAITDTDGPSASMLINDS